MTYWRTYLLGIVGLAAITFPFLWLELHPKPADQTVTVGWALGHGAQFFTDLVPVFVVGLLIWLGIITDRHWHWQRALGQSGAGRSVSGLLANYGRWIALAVVFLGPAFLSASSISLLTDAGIFMLLALGLNITVGMTGLLVLGYAGFYAFGAYLFAVGQGHLGFFPWWLAAPVAFPLGAAVGYLLGLPCLRLRGDYLAIVTLGFGEAFHETIKNLDFLGGTQGLDVPKFAAVLGLRNGQVAYLVTALVLVIALVLVQRLYHSPVGRAWIAIRENEIAAGSLGVPVVQMKLLAFSLSAAIAAVAGVLSAAKIGFVSPDLCEFKLSIMVLAMVILGGLGNSYGALLGAALLYLVPQYLELLHFTIESNPTLSATIPSALQESLAHLSDYRLLLFGAIMVLMMLYRPQGLLGTSRRKQEILNQ
jgi:branched-chain amino acid transport system permease protein